MSFSDARRNYEQQANSARSQHWELQSDFDFLLAKLYSEDSTLAIRYRDASRNGLIPQEEFSTMDRVRTIWRRIFPGREIFFQESAPQIRVSGLEVELEYPVNTASDAEKAALYLLGKTLDAPSGVILIDEPETHFHSLLAVEMWNELEEARLDLRFIYITHDLQFALSRHEAAFILATPGKFEILQEELPGDIAGALLTCIHRRGGELRV